MSKLFDKALSQVTDETKRFVNNTIDIVDQIDDYLKIKNMTRKDLAARLSKKESEISKWMSGTHNFTLRSISKIESALKESIITTPHRVNQEFDLLEDETIYKNPARIVRKKKVVRKRKVTSDK